MTFTATMTDLHRLIRDNIEARDTFPSRDTIIRIINTTIDNYFDDPRMTDAELDEYRNAMRFHYNI